MFLPLYKIGDMKMCEEELKLKKVQYQKRCYIGRILGILGCIILLCGCIWVVLQKKEIHSRPMEMWSDEFVSKENFLGQENKKINVEPILQNPELPTGCEATAGAMILKGYGYRTDKIQVAEQIKKVPMEEKNGRYHAPHPNKAFIGDPSSTSSYGAFPHVLAEAVQNVIDMQQGEHIARELYGYSEEEILNMVDNGIPVCIWTSMYDLEIEYKRGWYVKKDGEYSDEYFLWPSNEHVCVLTGYDEDSVTVCDPLVGVCEYPKESFFRHYEQMGHYAMILEKRK